MAKLFDLEEKEIKRKNLVKTLITLGLIFSFTFGCLSYYKSYDKSYEEATEYMIGVHIKGAVKNSGFYSVPYGTRVKEVAECAGGFSASADTDGVNLAGYVYDGQEIYVPYKGSAQTGAINLNTATKKDLMTVSGIGEKSADAILVHRESHGGFHTVLELKEILNEKTYNAVCEKFYVE